MASARPWYGMNWIRQEKRQRIYDRDDRRCVYCGSSESLTLDHLTPRSDGGSNHETNLVTACHACNSRRQDQPVVVFVGGHRFAPAIAAIIFEQALAPLPTRAPRSVVAR